MSNIYYKNSPIEYILRNGQVFTTLQYEDFLYNTNTFSKAIVKDFLDSTGSYVQLRAIQIMPYDEFGIYKEDGNKLVLFAQTKEQISEGKYPTKDNFGYIGTINVDKNFKIDTVQRIVDELGQYYDTLGEYFGDLYDNSYYFTYDDFSGNGYKNTVYFGGKGKHNKIKKVNSPLAPIQATEEINKKDTVINGKNYYFYKKIEEEQVKYYLEPIDNINNVKTLTAGSGTLYLDEASFSYEINNDILTLTPLNFQLQLTDVCVKGKDINEDNTDTWSLLYIPYLANEQIEVFVCALLKSTNTKINPTIVPNITLSMQNNGNTILELYNSNKQSNFFISSRAGGSTILNNYNFLELDAPQSLQSPQENDEIDLTSWPLENKKYNEVLLYENCYYSLNGSDWIPVKRKITNSEGKIVGYNINIDLESNETTNLPASDNFVIYRITDKNTGLISNNGDIIINSKNKLTIPVINNFFINVRSCFYLRIYKEE